MKLEKERQEVVDACKFMRREGLVVGTAGNVSVRVGDLVAVSPSGVDYETMTAKDVCVVDMDGNIVEADLTPSSETPLHLLIYHNIPAGAVTHNHAPASTALGLVVDEVPTSHYYTSLFGGPIRVAPYAQFGTDDLARNVETALEGRLGALMANHGAITIGPNLNKALSLLPYLEYVCEVELRALATGLPVRSLDEGQIANAIKGMAHYGENTPKNQ
jgi:Ribulose-5-phosphate 4-epimerase and related epimerases and aldolases